MLNRIIAVDWSLSKTLYNQHLAAATLTPSTPITSPVTIKQETLDDNDDLGSEIDIELDEKKQKLADKKAEKHAKKQAEKEEKRAIEKAERVKLALLNTTSSYSSDIHEGRTLFVRNLSLETTELALKTFFEQYVKKFWGNFNIEVFNENFNDEILKKNYFCSNFLLQFYSFLLSY